MCFWGDCWFAFPGNSHSQMVSACRCSGNDHDEQLLVGDWMIGGNEQVFWPFDVWLIALLYGNTWRHRLPTEKMTTVNVRESRHLMISLQVDLNFWKCISPIQQLIIPFNGCKNKSLNEMTPELIVVLFFSLSLSLKTFSFSHNIFCSLGPASNCEVSIDSWAHVLRFPTTCSNWRISGQAPPLFPPTHSTLASRLSAHVAPRGRELSYGSRGLLGNDVSMPDRSFGRRSPQNYNSQESLNPWAESLKWVKRNNRRSSVEESTL